MSNDIGLPLTTNRAGSWNSGPAVAPRVDQRPNHLSEVLQPMKEKGIQHVQMTGLDTEAEKLRDLVNGDQREMDKLGRAINDAIKVSCMTNPQILGKDKKDHQITQGEVKRRIQWCIEIAQAMRFDARPKWSFEKIIQHLPHLLGHHLDGTFWSAIVPAQKRGMYAVNQVPRGLRPKPEEG